MIQTDQAVGRGSGRGAWTLRERGAVGLAGLVRPHQAARGCVERRRAGRESVAWCSACSHPAQPSSPACSLCAGSADACPSSSSAGTRGGSETRPGPPWPLCAAVSQACSRPCATRCVCVLVVRLGTPRSAPCSRPRRRIQRLVRQENWAVWVGWPATEANGGADALTRVFGRGSQPGFDRVAGGVEVWPAGCAGDATLSARQHTGSTGALSWTCSGRSTPLDGARSSLAIAAGLRPEDRP